MKKEEFYRECARLLDTSHDYRQPSPIPTTPGRDGLVRNTYKTRWNGRDPGNGRFIGRGIIHHHGTTISVALRQPMLHGNYPSECAALAAIQQAVAQSNQEESP